MAGHGRETLNDPAMIAKIARTPRQAASIHDTLVAWQAGRLTSRQAMALCGIDSFDGLYLAARHSGVPLRKTLLAREKRAADLATAAIRERLSRMPADRPALVGASGRAKTKWASALKSDNGTD